MAQSWLRLVRTLLAVLLICFCAAPWFAFRAVRAAAQARDFQALDQLIDYPAVRQGLYRQAQTVQTPAPDFWRDPVGAVKRAVRPMAAAQAVENLMTPQAIAAMTEGEPVENRAQAQIEDLIPGLQGRSIRYWDPNRCRIAVRSSGGQESLFSFERRGWFTWKLVQIRPPPTTGGG